MACGSKHDSGSSNAPAIRSTAVSFGSRTSTSKTVPAVSPAATSCAVMSRTVLRQGMAIILLPTLRSLRCAARVPLPKFVPTCGTLACKLLVQLDRHLSSDLDDAASRNVEVVGRIVGGPRQGDKESILPVRHP